MASHPARLACVLALGAIGAIPVTGCKTQQREDVSRPIPQKSTAGTTGPLVSEATAALDAGNREEALRLLRQAYKARPDAEIGAHLGEVLWAMGRRDEARQVWAEASGRDAGNDVLRETLVRLKAQ